MLAATAVALVVRLLYVLAYPQVEALCPDCGAYDRVAVNLSAGLGFVDNSSDAVAHGGPGPVASMGPVYPAFLSAIYRGAGHRFEAVRIAQAVVGALMVPMLWRLTAFAFGPGHARVGAWLAALSPPLVTYTGTLLTETLSATLLVAAIWAFVVATRRGSAAWFAAAGIIGGVLVLAREEMLTVLAVVMLAGAWTNRPAHTLVYLAAIAACMGPWTARNYIVFQKPILVTAHGGETLWISAKGWNEWQFDEEGYRRLVDGHDYVERDAILRRDAIRMIAAAPARYIVSCVKRLPELWISSHTSYVRGLSQSFATYSADGAYARLAAKLTLLTINMALLALAAWGAATWRREAAAHPFDVLLVALPVLSITAVHFFLFATSRYQVPVLPFVTAFAARGLSPALARGVRTAAPPA